MHKIALLALVLSLSALSGCQEPAGEASPSSAATAETPSAPLYDYDQLGLSIAYGRASLAEVRQALTDRDIGRLTNTMHGLYSMRWHRGVYNLLFDMWSAQKESYPELAWDLIAKAPVRIALASTITRVEIFKADEYRDYIREHRYDEHEFHRAQVAVALGLNGDPVDVDYIREMAAGDNHYVAQSAITALSLMSNSQKARDAMLELSRQFQDTARGRLIDELLEKAFKTPMDNLDPDKSSPAYAPG